MSRVLILCSRTPYPPYGGAKLRMYHTAQLLNREHTVEIAVIGDEPQDDSTVSEFASEFADIHMFRYPSYQCYLNAAIGLVSRLPLQTHYYSFARVDDWIRDRVDQYDLVFCNHIRTAEYARGLDVPAAIDLVDAVSRTYQRASKSVSGVWKAIYAVESRRVPRYERRVIDDFDTAFVTSSVDKQFIERGWRNASELNVVPNGVREEVLERGPALTRSSPSPTLAFLGKMDYFANEDGVKYFSNQIFPAIRETIPDVRFRILGMNPTTNVRKLGEKKGIEVTGFVEDPSEHLAAADIVVAPLRYGSGIQNKILEAMALGKAVVTTPLGAEGINGQDGMHFIVADSPTAFADSTITLLNDESRRAEMGQNARDLIYERYTWDAVAESLLGPIQELLREAGTESKR